MVEWATNKIFSATERTDIEALNSTRWISWWDISINGWDNTKVDITAWTWVVYNPLTGANTRVSFWPFTAVVVTWLTTDPITYFNINSAWALIQRTASPNQEEIRTSFWLWAVLHVWQTVVESILNDFSDTTAINQPLLWWDFFHSFWIVNSNWNVFLPNWANLNINKSVWLSFAPWTRAKSNPDNPNFFPNPSITLASFLTTWRDWAWGFNIGWPDTAITPWLYDDWTWWASQPNWTVSNNFWSVQRIYLVIDDNSVVVHYWQEAYSSYEAALNWIQAESFTQNPLLWWAALRWFLIVKWNAADLSNTSQAVFIKAWKLNETPWGSRWSSTADLQTTYNNSTTPEILTDITRGAFSVKRWSAADTDCIFEWLNGAWTQTFCVTWEWDVTVSWDTIIQWDLTVNWTTTYINTTDLDVTDKNITVNSWWNDASSEWAWLTIDRTWTDWSLIYADAATSKFKIWALWSEVEIADISSAQTFTNKTFDANWTWNSLSNVDVADLANWTDWELITWDAAWAPATVAVWTADQVLTSNWVWEAPTFQDAAWWSSYPVNLYESSSQSVTANTIYTFTHNLWLTEADVKAAKYKVFITYQDGVQWMIGWDQVGRTYYWWGTSTTSQIQVEHNWNAADPWNVYNVNHQTNALKIKWWTVSCTNARLIIQQIYS